ncbi:MAG: hypothetical protein H6815_05680 [Phycisphaeraceae bacterium]|nr:hypothetical protein [Phycisphaerales bacterium]MCB9859928.1 hypothetical protein [Phycisphaeraceae bacterium]
MSITRENAVSAEARSQPVDGADPWTSRMPGYQPDQSTDTTYDVQKWSGTAQIDLNKGPIISLKEVRQIRFTV